MSSDHSRKPDGLSECNVGSMGKSAPIAKNVLKWQLLAQQTGKLLLRGRGPSGFDKFINHMVSTRL
jgi:hypothetical protein